jgi:2-dehydro-3-deoxy-D-arabinonate dehydratase
MGLADLLALPLQEARTAYESAGERLDEALVSRVLAPVDVQEVWACGVTYERSRAGRAEESGHSTVYDDVYEADRPEIFFKSTAHRVVGDGDAVGIRRDSGWDVPEAELGVVVNATGEIFGYVAGNDMSSRSIEGANPLYLPQAKMYSRSCAVGPGIVPSWETADGPFAISVTITRDGNEVFSGTTSTSQMKRNPAELVDWVTRAMEFPHGLVLLTGTGVVPSSEFTLQSGDSITVEIDGVGKLTNSVTVVGR